MPVESVLIPFDKWEPDASDYGQHGLELAQNLAWSNGIYHPVRQVEQPNATLAGAAAWAAGVASFPSISNIDATFFGSVAATYYYTGTAAAVNLGGAAASGQRSFARFGNTICYATTLNPMQGSTALGAFANLITSVLTPRARYLTSIKTHLCAGYVDDGAAGAFDGTKFWWSARNSAVDWQPGSNRAGFANIRPGVGIITGVVGFEDFGLIFAEYAVYLVEYVGGENVWALHQIGAAHEGLALSCDQSIAVIGTDVYYWSRSGPAVVRGGERVVSLGLGSVRRYVTEQRWTGWGPVRAVFGSADSRRPMVAWYAGTDLSGSRTLELLYNPTEDVWSTLAGGTMTGSTDATAEQLMGLCPTVRQFNTSPFGTHPADGFDILIRNGASGAIKLRRLSSPTTTLGAHVLTQRKWSAYPNSRTMLHALRLFWRPVEETAGALLATPAATITVTPSNNLHFSDALTPLVFTDQPNVATNKNDNGYVVMPASGGTLPVEYQFFDISVSLPSFQGMASSLVGVEVLVTPGSSLQ